MPLNRNAPDNSRGHISAVASTAICLRINEEYLAVQTRRYFEIDIALAMMHVCWLFDLVVFRSLCVALHVVVHCSYRAGGGDLYTL